MRYTSRYRRTKKANPNPKPNPNPNPEGRDKKIPERWRSVRPDSGQPVWKAWGSCLVGAL